MTAGRIRFLATLALGLGAPAPVAFAQAADGELGVIPASPEAAAPAEVADEAAVAPSSLGEIIVTAQRREENIQDVAISITVFDQEQIAKANMTNSADLARYTPSLSANTRFGAENATFTIRGFTQDLRTTASVGTYFAEVVAPHGQSTQTSGDGAGPGTLFDLQNVQVLKGPQGTLFGRNTTGGAILIVPQKPTDTFGGYAEFTKGDFDAVRGQGVVNVPFTDHFRMRFGLDYNERDGHLHNVSGIGADDLGNVDYLAGRISAVWDVSDTLENYAIVSWVDSESHGNTQQLYACNNLLGNAANPGDYDVQELIGGLVDIITTGEIDLTNPLPGVPLGGSPFALLTFQPCQQQLDDQAASGDDGFYDLVSDVKTPVTEIEERRIINTTTWSITDDLTFKNILAYAHLTTRNGSNIFGNLFPDPSDPSGRRHFGIGHTIVRPGMPVTSQETWVEEMQLQGKAWEGDLVWQTGAYYEHSKPDGFSGNNTAALLYCDVATLEGQPSGFDCFDPLLGILGGALRYKVKTEYLNRAVYAQGTYHLLDPLSVTLGLRHTWDETEGEGVKELYRYALSVQQAPDVTIQTPEVESDATTGMVELNYKPTDDVMTYAKYTRGYRQGTVNMLADPGLDTHEPEKVDTYEIGLKSTLDWPVPARFNVALFSNTLTNMQLQGGYISTTSGPTTAIFNAGKGRSRGVEVEAFFQPLRPLTASVSYAYLDTKLLKSADFCSRVEAVGFLEGFSCTPIADVGDELPFAPESAVVTTLDWFLPVPESFGQVDIAATYAWTGRQRVASSSASPFAVLDSFGVLNLNLSWTALFGSAFDLNLFATNVLDEEFIVFTSGTYRPLGIESRSQGMPRMIGARLRFNF
ncbi:MAG TPA: TonB-dependent receptor [Nevskiaceae bacterium]|nr:TonB-dependent receptor [Nevskiaceae bacterium]